MSYYRFGEVQTEYGRPKGYVSVTARCMKIQMVHCNEKLKRLAISIPQKTLPEATRSATRIEPDIVALMSGYCCESQPVTFLQSLIIESTARMRGCLQVG